jgi:predicted AAA+ superfamily ATPase
MEKADLLKEIYRQNPWFNGERTEPKKPVVERDLLKQITADLDPPQALAVLGLRRCGKTTLLRLLIRELQKSNDPKHILYFSFDLSGQADIRKVLDVYEEEILQQPFPNLKDRVYILLDEVQKVTGWGDQVKSFIDKEYKMKFVLTGSSSMHMTKGAGESLIGRIRFRTLYPFSFREFLRYRGIRAPVLSLDRVRMLPEPIPVRRAFLEYLQVGGLPELYEGGQNDLLAQNLDLTFFRDIVEIFPVKRTDVLKAIFLMIAENSGQRVNFENMSRDLKTQYRTVREYVQHLKDSFLLSTSAPYLGNLSATLRKGEKAYVSDNAYLNLVDCKDGLKAETAAFNHLRRLEDVWYLKDPEVDILLPRRKLAIEVKFGRKVERSDCRNLLKAPMEYSLILVTEDTYDKWSFEKRTVQVIPLWLLCLCE